MGRDVPTSRFSPVQHSRKGVSCSASLGPRAVEQRAPEWLLQRSRVWPFLTLCFAGSGSSLAAFPSQAFKEFQLGEGWPGHKALAIKLHIACSVRQEVQQSSQPRVK